MFKSKLMMLAVLPALLLAGCGKDDAARTFSPVPFDKHDRCIICGMVILNYEGPKAEVFIKGAENDPVKFCSVRDAFTFALQPENKRRLLAFFVHDISRTDFLRPDDKFLVPAQNVTYVYGSDQNGVMGPEPIAFSKKEDAEKFAKEHGGKLCGYDDITLALLNS